MKSLAYQVAACCTIALLIAAGNSWLHYELAQLPRFPAASLAAAAERQNTWASFATVFVTVFTLTMLWSGLRRWANHIRLMPPSCRRVRSS